MINVVWPPGISYINNNELEIDGTKFTNTLLIDGTISGNKAELFQTTIKLELLEYDLENINRAWSIKL